MSLDRPPAHFTHIENLSPRQKRTPSLRVTEGFEAISYSSKDDFVTMLLAMTYEPRHGKQPKVKKQSGILRKIASGFAFAMTG